MPGEGGVCGVTVDVLLDVAVFAGALAVDPDDGALDVGVVAGLAIIIVELAAGVVVVAGFDVVAVVPVAGFIDVLAAGLFVEVVPAVLPAELLPPLLLDVPVDDVPVPVFDDFDFLLFEVVVVVLLDEVELVAGVVCARSACGTTVTASNAPKNKGIISFLA
jgi:hypothetical protein